MKLFSTLIAVLIVFAFAAAVFAVSAGKTVDYEGGGAGKVVFDGKAHSDKGLKCGDCHPGLFQMKKGAVKITMADINTGKSCGACHDGAKAFKASEPANCAKCHKK